MKTSIITLILYLATLTLSTPITSLSEDYHSDVSIRSPSSLYAPLLILYKRKGGGGGKGGGGVSSSGSSGGSSSGRSGGGIAGSGRPASSFSFSSSSNLGGRTRTGSGASPAYPGGRYAGGATVPFTAGRTAGRRGVSPAFIGVGVGLAIFPGVFLVGGLYAYGYGYPYYWNENGRNRTANATCVCGRYSVCGCDPDADEDTLKALITNGTGGPPLNTSTVRTVDYGNNNITTYINGTLPNGTTASGGTDPSTEDEIQNLAVRVFGGKFAGWWVMVGVVVAGVMMV